MSKEYYKIYNKRIKEKDFGLYYKYYTMRSRCYSKSHSKYKFYGARGIVSDWNSYEEFKKDMFFSFKKHVTKFGLHETTLDRKDPNKNYSKDNCQWVTRLKQGCNRRNNVILKYKDKELTVSEWSRKFKIKPCVIFKRIQLGWSIEDILLKPVKKYKNRNMV